MKIIQKLQEKIKIGLTYGGVSAKAAIIREHGK